MKASGSAMVPSTSKMDARVASKTLISMREPKAGNAQIVTAILIFVRCASDGAFIAIRTKKISAGSTKYLLKVIQVSPECQSHISLSVIEAIFFSFWNTK